MNPFVDALNFLGNYACSQRLVPLEFFPFRLFACIFRRIRGIVNIFRRGIVVFRLFDRFAVCAKQLHLVLKDLDCDEDIHVPF